MVCCGLQRAADQKAFLDLFGGVLRAEPRARLQHGTNLDVPATAAKPPLFELRASQVCAATGTSYLDSCTGNVVQRSASLALA